MNNNKKQKMIDNLVITEKTKEFLKGMDPNFGHLIKNGQKKSDNDPDFVGWARLTNGTVIAIEGNLNDKGGKLSVPLKVVEVPPSMIGEEEVVRVNVPKYQSKVDEFLKS